MGPPIDERYMIFIPFLPSMGLEVFDFRGRRAKTFKTMVTFESSPKESTKPNTLPCKKELKYGKESQVKTLVRRQTSVGCFQTRSLGKAYIIYSIVNTGSIVFPIIRYTTLPE